MIDGLINKLGIKVAFWRVLNYDIIHWADIFTFWTFVYINFNFKLFPKWAKMGTAIMHRGAPDRQRGDKGAPHGQTGDPQMGREGPRSGLSGLSLSKRGSQNAPRRSPQME